jgi:hypothetical protein
LLTEQPYILCQCGINSFIEACVVCFKFKFCLSASFALCVCVCVCARACKQCSGSHFVRVCRINPCLCADCTVARIFSVAVVALCWYALKHAHFRHAQAPPLERSVLLRLLRVLNCGQFVSFPLISLGVHALCVFYFLKCFSVSLAQAPPLLELPLVLVQVCAFCVRPLCVPAVSVRVACRACVRCRSRG